jgi:xRRM domain
MPTCKSFALVTLSHEDDVDTLLQAWPWNHPMDTMNSNRPGIKTAVVNTKGKGKDKHPPPHEEISSLHVEATKSGLRILTKAKWEELRAEYLLYRQELVDEINKFQDEDEVEVYGGGRKRRYVDEIHDQGEQSTAEESRRTVQESTYIQSRTRNTAIAVNESVTASVSTYPPGCLVFIRNVHPQTNKTSLRNLFLHARELTRTEGGNKDDGGLDYIDYTKGMGCVCLILFYSFVRSQSNHKLTVLRPITYASARTTTRALPFLHSNRPNIWARRFRG